MPQAVDSALACLRLFGIDIPAHPTPAQVKAEYETVWRTLDGRPIESLIDLPLMTDPELQAAMQLLSILTPSAYFTDLHLFCLLVCRMVNLSMQHGTGGASAHAFGILGHILGPTFHRYGEGLSIRQARMRAGREARLHRLPCEGLPCDGASCSVDAADHDGDRSHAGDLSHRDRNG